MPLSINDKKIDAELMKIIENLRRVGINASKTDAIRYLLKMRKQGKKTHRKWKDVI